MEVFKTLHENYSSRLQSIPWVDIPRTFRDAIKVTRALGIGYIWIDSICIIQGDQRDWEREAANMHSIYENSYVTIGATSASGPSGGLYLRKRSGIFEETGTTSSGDYFSVMGRGSPEHPDERDGVFKRRKYYQQPLMKRAWVMQERLLSPRFLHFTCYEVMWECKSDVSCECGETTVKQMSMKQALHKAFDDPKDIAKAWRQVVTSYSLLSLTKESDKLSALSGLASKVAAKRPGSDYLAGIWSDSIDHDLLWRVQPSWGPLQDRRPAEWRAPTWSWASLDSRIEFPDEGTVTRLYQTISHTRAVPATGDKWGQVTQGSLQVTIRGLLFPAKIEMEGYNETGMTLAGRRVNFSRRGSQSSNIVLHIDTRDDMSFLKDNTVFCLRLARLQHGDRESEHTLVLRFDHGSAKYERIGIIEQERMSFYGRTDASWASDEDPFAQGGEERTVEIV